MKSILFILVMFAAGVFGEETRETATFKEGAGILMGPESKESIGLMLAEVEERSAPVDIRITAQVYREAHEASQNQGEPSGFAYASAWIDPADADKLEPGMPLVIQGNGNNTGTVIRLDRMMSANGGRVELLIQVKDGDSPGKIGDFVYAYPVAAEGLPVVLVPATALLETAYGPFVYVVNGSYFVRTAIEIGSRFGDFVEITDGLYEGDQVVAQAVETLYLIELRATKGGGHSH